MRMRATFVAVVLILLSLLTLTAYHVFILDDRMTQMQDQFNNLDLTHDHSYAAVDHAHPSHTHDYADALHNHEPHEHPQHSHEEIVEYQRRLCNILNITNKNVMTIAKYLRMPIQPYARAAVVDPTVMEAIEIILPEMDYDGETNDN